MPKQISRRNGGEKIKTKNNLINYLNSYSLKNRITKKIK